MQKWLKNTLDKSPTLGTIAIVLLTISTTVGVVQTVLISIQVLDSIIAYIVTK